jgi:hypothetical protein
MRGRHARQDDGEGPAAEYHRPADPELKEAPWHATNRTSQRLRRRRTRRHVALVARSRRTRYANWSGNPRRDRHARAPRVGPRPPALGPRRSTPRIRRAAARCRRCPSYRAVRPPSRDACHATGNRPQRRSAWGRRRVDREATDLAAPHEVVGERPSNAQDRARLLDSSGVAFRRRDPVRVRVDAGVVDDGVDSTVGLTCSCRTRSWS